MMGDLRQAMADLREQLSYHPPASFSPPGASWVQICKPDPMRTAIVVGVATAAVFLLPDPQPQVNQQGYELDSSLPFYVLRVQDLGPLIQAGWWAQSTGGLSTVTVTEVYIL